MALEQDLLMEAIKDLKEKVSEVNGNVNSLRSDLARMEIMQTKADARINVLAAQCDSLADKHERLSSDFYAYRQNQKGHEEERIKSDKQMASRVTTTATVISIVIAIAGLVINFVM